VRIIVDECVNPRVKRLLEPEHAVSTVLDLGWGGSPDHVLVERMQERCDVFLTIDQGFEHEHNLTSLHFGTVIVHVARNRIVYYEVLLEKISRAIASIKSR
jgi:predicted nuclease of predicted toxin-antitoxin system